MSFFISPRQQHFILTVDRALTELREGTVVQLKCPIHRQSELTFEHTLEEHLELHKDYIVAITNRIRMVMTSWQEPKDRLELLSRLGRSEATDKRVRKATQSRRRKIIFSAMQSMLQGKSLYEVLPDLAPKDEPDDGLKPENGHVARLQENIAMTRDGMVIRLVLHQLWIESLKLRSLAVGLLPKV